MSLTVIDFFCGGGGFSEGFRQAGFNVIWAVDLWQTAVDTHNENHPECNAIKDNVIRISNLPDEEFHKLVPDSDVIIGSPPCTAFSNSNKSGKGDKAKGIELIEAYLRIVFRKKFKKGSILKYWILENVPKVNNYIKDCYSAADLNLKGKLSLKVKGEGAGIYNAVYYGVPSARKRFFCGDFPIPMKIFKKDSELIPLKAITEALGAPKHKLTEEITDPIWRYKIKGIDLSDHHYIQELAEFEWQTAKRLKQDKGYMGKMSFPENRDKPARTIMATMSFSARESFILANGVNKYRAPTIREVASFMSFPIDYRFYGNSFGTKYKLVGNAVPPKMAYAFAKAIMKAEGLKTQRSYYHIKHKGELDFVNLDLNEFNINVDKPKKVSSKFKYHIPYFIFDAFRVELTNYRSDFKKEKIKWEAEIHYSQGPRAKIFTPLLNQIDLTLEEKKQLDEFLRRFKGKESSAKKFQEVFCKTSTDRKANALLGPFELLGMINEYLTGSFVYNKSEEKISLKCDDSTIIKLPRKIAIGYYILYKSLSTLKLS